MNETKKFVIDKNEPDKLNRIKLTKEMREYIGLNCRDEVFIFIRNGKLKIIPAIGNTELLEDGAFMAQVSSKMSVSLPLELFKEFDSESKAKKISMFLDNDKVYLSTSPCFIEENAITLDGTVFTEVRNIEFTTEMVSALGLNAGDYCIMKKAENGVISICKEENISENANSEIYRRTIDELGRLVLPKKLTLEFGYDNQNDGFVANIGQDEIIIEVFEKAQMTLS